MPTKLVGLPSSMPPKDDEKVVSIVPPGPNPEMVEAMKYWLSEAMKGRYTGAAIILLKPGGDYECDACGTALEEVACVCGLLPELDAALRKIMKSG